MNETDDSEEEVDSGKEVVLGLDDHAPASPDETGAGQGKVLGEGELLGGACEVGDTGKDESPLHDRSPEVHSLDADLALPHALEPRLRLLLSSAVSALPSSAALVEALGKALLTESLASLRTEGGLAEGRSGGAEDGVDGRRSHGFCYRFFFGG